MISINRCSQCLFGIPGEDGQIVKRGCLKRFILRPTEGTNGEVSVLEDKCVFPYVAEPKEISTEVVA